MPERLMLRAALAAALLGASFAAAPLAQAVVVGPQVDTTYIGSDSGGQRINIDQNNPVILGPGTYTAASFTLFVVAPSQSTIPFLVANADLSTPNPSSDVDSYRILAVGSTYSTTPPPGNVPLTFPFGGGANATFTLPETTKVFAAVSSGNDDTNSVGFKTGGTVDHNNSFAAPFVPTVGGTTPAFSNPDLARTYGFNIDVGPGVPEPAALGFFAVSACLLFRVRRRSVAV